MVQTVDRQFVAQGGVTLLTIVALSMAAATLTTAQAGAGATGAPGTFGAPEAPMPGEALPDFEAGQISLVGEGTNGAETIRLADCNALLASIPGGVLYFGGLAGLLYGVKRRFSLGTTLFAGYVILPVALAVYFLQTDCISTGGSSTGPNGPLPPGGPGSSAIGSAPTGLVLGGFAVLFVGAAAALYVSSGRTDGAEAAAEDDLTDVRSTDPADIGEAAASAAERLRARDADVDNEVYRAWWEMTQLLDVSSPETHTPGEFADAAVAVGIDRAHVDPLRQLFEEVRYGHADAEAREDRAVAVFETIAETYAESGRVDGTGD